MKNYIFASAILLSTTLFAKTERSFTEHKIAVGTNDIYAREYAGADPALILLHGFPDNHSLYDSLVNKLENRHVIVFDFIGWGLSDKPNPKNYPYSDVQQEVEIDAVVKFFNLNAVVLAPSDMSGSAAINWALDHKSKSAGLILFNTYFQKSKYRHLPFTGQLLTIPGVRQFTLPFCVPNFLFNPVIKLSIGGFFASKQTRKAFIPQFMGQFKKLSGKRAFFRTVGTTNKIAKRNLARVPELKAYAKPVSIIFGEKDKSFTKGLGEEFHTMIATSELHIIQGAVHYPQIDKSKEVADIIVSFMNKTK